MRRPSWASWLAARGDAYTTIVTALCLNVPFLFLALARHLEGVHAIGLAGLYVALVFLGYYGLLAWLLVSAVSALALLSPRLGRIAAGAMLAASLFYLVVNGVVHHVYRFHLDAFWLQLVLTSYSGLGIPASLLGTAIGLLALVAALQWGLFRVARRLPHRGVIAAGFVAASLASLLGSQAIHVMAYHANDARITSITPQLPFYYPITSHKHAAKYAGMMPAGLAAEPAGARGSTSLRYPRRPVDCPLGVRRANVVVLLLESWRYDMMDSLVSPHMNAIGRRSSVFLRHFSSGNATPTGVFGLLYGIHPTYWTAVKANSATIDNPVLIDLLQDHGYAFGIFADSHFDKHKIKDTMFRGIEVHEAFAGATADAKDQDMTNDLLEFMRREHRAGRPFFGFAFYKSTHYSYYYPKGEARFLPSQKLNVGLVGNTRNPSLYLNDYRNAIHWVDELIGGLLEGMGASGLLDETIVVITSDHGEEFNDNHANYWGHTSNFTQYQTRVPMIVYVPWEQPRRVEEVTAHVDVPPTLIEEALGCHPLAADYSNGSNLFLPLPRHRPLVIGSYVNHAIVMDEDVYAIYPMMVQKYRLSDINGAAGPVRPDLAKQAMEEMHRFYGAADDGREGEPRAAR